MQWKKSNTMHISALNHENGNVWFVVDSVCATSITCFFKMHIKNARYLMQGEVSKLIKFPIKYEGSSKTFMLGIERSLFYKMK